MSAIVTPTRRRWALNYYITQYTRNSLSWGSDELEISGRENQHPERLGPQVPGWAAQENGKETLMAIRVGVNMLQFCSVSNSLSHTTLSIKWEVYFSKNRVARLYCVVIMIQHACRCICIMCLYRWSLLYNTGIIIPAFEWILEQWQWIGTPHSSKFQERSLTVRLFSKEVLFLSRNKNSVFYSFSWQG